MPMEGRPRLIDRRGTPRHALAHLRHKEGSFVEKKKSLAAAALAWQVKEDPEDHDCGFGRQISSPTPTSTFSRQTSPTSTFSRQTSPFSRQTSPRKTAKDYDSTDGPRSPTHADLEADFVRFDEDDEESPGSCKQNEAECLEFLEAHLPGMDEKVSDLSRKDLQRLHRVARLVRKRFVKRGSVLVSQGDTTGKTIYFLRRGTIAVHTASGTTSTPRGAWVRCAPAMAHISKPGQLFATSAAVLGEPEPVTLRVVSSSCDLFTLPWSDACGLLPSRLVDAMHEHSLRSHERRTLVTAPSALGRWMRDQKRWRAATSCQGKISESSLAWQYFFDAAQAFSDVPCEVPGALTTEAKIASGNLVSVSADGLPKTGGAEGDTNLPDGARAALEFGVRYAAGINDALNQLLGTGSHEICNSDSSAPDISTMRSLVPSLCVPHALPSKIPRAPPDMSSERIRAEMLQAANQDCHVAWILVECFRPNIMCQRLLRKALNDHNSSDVDAWIAKYMLDPRMAGNPHVQECVRRYFADRPKIIPRHRVSEGRMRQH